MAVAELLTWADEHLNPCGWPHPWRQTLAEFIQIEMSVFLRGGTPRPNLEVESELAAALAPDREYAAYMLAQQKHFERRERGKPSAFTRNLEIEQRGQESKSLVDRLRSEIRRSGEYAHQMERLPMQHRMFLDHALREGRVIPDRVLAEYPDFRERYDREHEQHSQEMLHSRQRERLLVEDHPVQLGLFEELEEVAA